MPSIEAPLKPIVAPSLQTEAMRGAGVVHAFFTRQGGLSRGIYATLNGGVGSRDDRETVLSNRRRMAGHLGVAPDRLLVPYQIHSAEAHEVGESFAGATPPRCDGLVTRQRGTAIGVTGADCGVILLADAQAGVVGAAHAGWKGAFGGVLEATVDAMVGLGARPAAITAALGPTIGPRSYEVGPEFVDRFVAADAAYRRFFAPSDKDAHALFDLPGFIGLRLLRRGIGYFEDLALDTYADETRFFSYRRATHRAEPDYGRLLAAIGLP